jgi:hypothetical protein
VSPAGWRRPHARDAIGALGTSIGTIRTVALPVRPLTATGPRHIVEFYDDDCDLVQGVTGFLSDGLNNGEVVIVVATDKHRAAIDQSLGASGVDLLTSRAEGRYLAIDADDLMLTFVREGRPEPGQFHTAVGGLLARLHRSGRPVRVFGEMVALLWAEGQVTGAIELEALWNELATQLDFQLYCAYPMTSIGGDADLASARHVCDLHTAVATPPGYASGETPDTTPTSAQLAAAIASRVFVPVPLAARAVRRFVRETLAAWGEHTVVDDAVLVASELTTNALLHAASPFRLAMARLDRTVRIEVHDGDAVHPEQRAPFDHATSGRGVAIVAALVSRWGTEDADGGKVVWTELPVDPRR